jgi:hypothetical protein
MQDGSQVTPGPSSTTEELSQLTSRRQRYARRSTEVSAWGRCCSFCENARRVCGLRTIFHDSPKITPRIERPYFVRTKSISPLIRAGRSCRAQMSRCFHFQDCTKYDDGTACAREMSQTVIFARAFCCCNGPPVLIHSGYFAADIGEGGHKTGFVTPSHIRKRMRAYM